MTNRSRRMRSALLFLGLAVLTAGFTMAPSTHVPADASTGPAPDYLRTWVSTNGGGQSEQSYSRAEALDIARRYDLVVALQRTFEDHVTAMRATNPDLHMIAYDNIIMSRSSNPNEYPDSWYARTRTGRRITATADRIAGTVLLDPAHPGVRANAVQTCTDKMATGDYDGCYLDSLGVGHLLNLDGRPVNPATGRDYTDHEWITQTAGLAAHVRDRIDGMVLVNGLSKGSVVFDPDTEARRFFDASDGGNAEGWVRGAEQSVTSFRREDVWRQDVDLLVEAGRQGKSVIAMTKIWTPATKAQIDQWRRLAYASFFLGTDGNQYLYFNPEGPGKPPAHHPFDDIELGTPTGAYFKGDGLYQRWYTQGAAFVNAGTATATVQLGARYRNLDGTVVTKVTLAPNRADILRYVGPLEGGSGGGTGGQTPPGPNPPATATCWSETATIIGTSGDDVLVGTAGRDVIVGLGGDDVIKGLDGDDLICADGGADVVEGGNGNDTIVGGDGDDKLLGGSGNDLLRGNGGTDLLRGSAGDDTLQGGAGSGDGCYGGAGDDKADASCEVRKP